MNCVLDIQQRQGFWKAGLGPPGQENTRSYLLWCLGHRRGQRERRQRACRGRRGGGECSGCMLRGVFAGGGGGRCSWVTRATGLAKSGRGAQAGLKTRRPEFGEFILVQQEEGGPLAAVSPLEEEGDTGGVGGKATSSLHRETLVQAGSNGGRERDSGCWRRCSWASWRDNLEREEGQT